MVNVAILDKVVRINFFDKCSFTCKYLQLKESAQYSSLIITDVHVLSSIAKSARRHKFPK